MINEYFNDRDNTPHTFQNLEPSILMVTDTRNEEKKKKVKRWIEITGSSIKLWQEFSLLLSKTQIPY